MTPRKSFVEPKAVPIPVRRQVELNGPFVERTGFSTLLNKDIDTGFHSKVANGSMAREPCVGPPASIEYTYRSPSSDPVRHTGYVRSCQGPTG